VEFRVRPGLSTSSLSHQWAHCRPSTSGQSTHGLFFPRFSVLAKVETFLPGSIEKEKDDVQVEMEKKEQNPASSYEMTK